LEAALTKIVDALFGALDLFRFWVVLYEYERGVMLRLGRFHRELGPGWHWRAPFRIEELRFLNVRKQTSASWEQTLTTADGVIVTLGFDYMIEIRSVRDVLLNVEDWTRVSYNTTKMTLARSVEKATVAELLSKEFACGVHESVCAALAQHGIRLLDFALTDKCRSRAYRLFKGSK
jgi:regulator of protease activity HflC (stomatin/prohibitin superfamily)